MQRHATDMRVFPRNAAGQRAVMERHAPSAALCRQCGPRWGHGTHRLGCRRTQRLRQCSRRQRSWQRMCARSKRTDCRAGSSAPSGGAHRAGCSTCAAPFPNAHPWHTERTVAQRSPWITYARDWCSALSNAAAAARGAPRGVRLLHRPNRPHLRRSRQGPPSPRACRAHTAPF